MAPTQRTGSDGLFHFDVVPIGTYTLTAAADGYQPSAPLTVAVRDAETVIVEPVILQEEVSTSGMILYLPRIAAEPTAARAVAAEQDSRWLFLPIVER